MKIKTKKRVINGCTMYYAEKSKIQIIKQFIRNLIGGGK